MKDKMLFPRPFKWIGLLLFLVSFLIFPDATDLDNVHKPEGIYIQVMTFSGLLFMAGARIKDEDEWTQFVRLNSIKWAILLYMLLRLSFKVMAFALKDPVWLPDNFQINVLLIIFIIIFYTRVKLTPFIQNKFKGPSS